MRIIFIASIFFLTLAGCRQRFNYRALSEFVIDSTAIINGDSVLVIYSSGGPGFNTDLKYFHHVIAITKKNGDTINILATAKYDLEGSARKKVFYSYQSDENRILQSVLSGETAEYVKDLKLKPINTVISNPKFENVERNHYPTIIGIFAESEGVHKSIEPFISD